MQLHDAITDAIDRVLTWDLPDESLSGALSAVIGIANPSRSQHRHCSAVLRELLGPPDRIGGRSVWPVPFRTTT